MAEDNVIQFPGNPEETNEEPEKVSLTQEQMKKVIEKGQVIQLKKIDEDRISGLEAVDKALMGLDDPNLGQADDPTVEARLAYLESGVRGLATATNAINKLVEVTKHDLINMIQSLEQLSQDLWRKGAHLQTLIEVLKDKSLTSDAELKEKWDDIVPSAIEAMRKEVTPEKK